MTPNHLVLLVEDQADVRETLAALLELDGYQVATARDGVEALDVLRRGTEPCVLLLDLMMPRMDGWEVLRHLDEEPELPRPAVLLVSSVPDLEERARERQVGFVRKPVDLDRLLAEVRRYCPA